MTTERLYYTDSYLRSFRATVAGASDPCLVYLDRTAFYPSSGGQPYDLGTIAGMPVEEVIDEGDRIAHRLCSSLTSGEVDCEIDWQRRFDHMQQHTGQHLLSAVFADLLGLETISFHLGTELSTIDLAAGPAQSKQLADVERRANEIVTENRPVTITFENAATVQGLRKQPDRSGTIRVVTIDALDRSACGGTHVRSTGEIGCIFIRGIEKVRGNLRVEFVCGARGVARARADYNSLVSIARRFSAALDDAPALVESTMSRIEDLEKWRRKLGAEVAAARGRALYDGTEARRSGLRVYRKNASLTDDIRAEALAFTACPRAVYIAWQESPPSVLLACSADSGVHAGNTIKAAIADRGGRGGGSPTLAQASIPAGNAASEFLGDLESLLPSE